MSEPLVVHLNRDALHDVDPATDAYEADGDFAIAFRNHGRAVHVHLKLEGPLSHVAELGEPNHFVDTDGRKLVHVDVEDHTAPIEGWVEVVSGYGTEAASVPVTVGDSDDSVAIDEELTEPPADDAESLADTFTEDGEGGGTAFAVAVVAVALAVVAFLAAPSPTVGVAGAAVVVAAAVAGYRLLE